MIKKSGKKYKVMSESGKLLGEYTSLAAAKKRLGQIEYFKHKDSNKKGK